MVLIECPDCRHPIRIVDRRAGRFNPKCPKCSATFELVVPVREDEDVTATSLAAAKAETAGSQTTGRPEERSFAPEPGGESAPERGRGAGFRPHRLPRGVPRVLGGYV